MPLCNDTDSDSEHAKKRRATGTSGRGEKGGAMVATLESGALELRLATGEIFHLGEATITRIA